MIEIKENYDIVVLGNPNLRELSKPIKNEQFNSENLIEFGEKLLAQMYVHGGVGLAAPQIGVQVRMIAYGLKEPKPHRKDAKPIPDTILVNPTWQALTDDITSAYEGCLSVGKIMGKVKRFHKINVKAYDVYGQKLEFEAEGLMARIIQHETDHLDGKVFLDCMDETASLGFYEELLKINAFV